MSRLNPDPEEDDILAGEYVLGVLEADERFRVQARLDRDDAFRARVDAWAERLASLNDEFEPVPAPNILPRIEQRLFPRAQRKSSLLSWFVPTAALASLAALLVGAVIIFTAPSVPTVVVALTGDGTEVLFEARLIEASLTVARLEGASATDGTVFELWAIEDGQNPRSLGLLRDDGLTVPLDLSQAELTLAVSLEPAGGSPTGLPTGPVIASGKLAAP